MDILQHPTSQYSNDIKNNITKKRFEIIVYNVLYIPRLVIYNKKVSHKCCLFDR